MSNQLQDMTPGKNSQNETRCEERYIHPLLPPYDDEGSLLTNNAVLKPGIKSSEQLSLYR